MRSVGLGWRLLLFSVLLLAIPGLGYLQLQGMKDFLLQGQADAQQLVARALASRMSGRPEFLLPGGSDDRTLYVHLLRQAAQLDGYVEEWRPLLEQARRFPLDAPDAGGEPIEPGFTLLLGQRDGRLYGLLRVEDSTRVYRDPQHPNPGNSDQVGLAIRTPAGGVQRFLFAAEGEGSVPAVSVSPDWQRVESAVFGLEGVWRERAGGYDLEFRLPLDWLGVPGGILLSVLYRQSPAGPARQLYSSPGGRHFNPLVRPSSGLEEMLQSLLEEDDVACVVDASRRVLARFGRAGDELCRDGGRLDPQLVSGALAGESSGFRKSLQAVDWVIASQPVMSREKVMGAVVLARDSSRVLERQRTALARGLGATLVVWVLLLLGLLLFSGWLALRIYRLRRELEQAIDRDGRVLSARIRSAADSSDDLGELSRSISDLLERLQRYTGFLESVPRALRHELLNPLNVIGMTLERLQQQGEAEGPRPGDSGPAIRVAQQATRQLQLIVQGFTEAAHIDDALKQAENAPFDLAALLSEYAANRVGLSSDRCLVYQGPEAGLMVMGSDLRIAQLLDKIVDNAIDFAEPGSRVELDLARVGQSARITLTNRGPRIPEQILDSLFLGMASSRPGQEQSPHLGIGLFIARRIAVSHGGELAVRNLDDGVEVSLVLPLRESV